MTLEVSEGTFAGGFPYLRAGRGRPLVYLAGFAPNHGNPPEGFQRRAALRTVEPFVRAGYEVYLTNRRPGVPPGITWAEIAAEHAAALADRFDEPVDLIGHSSGGSLVLQVIADHPEVVRKAVAASAAYTLGPVAKRDQLELARELERSGKFRSGTLADGFTESPLLRRILAGPMWLATSLVKVADPADTIAMLRAEDGFDIRARLGDITTETLIICGARDYFWTPEMFAETAFRMPRGKLVMYPREGHGLVTKKHFFRDVLSFLDPQSEAAVRCELHATDDLPA